MSLIFYFFNIVYFFSVFNILETFLEEYNAESKKPMDLVLFMFATEHLTRIARVMSMPGGNALLVGMGGSGRQSLTRLAAFVLDFGIKQIELSKNYGVTEWRDDIRSVIKAAGLTTRQQGERRGGCFWCSDVFFYFVK